MILHANAALGRRQRLRLVSLVAGGVTIAAAAAIVGCSRQTGSKWVGRARRGESLDDRSSRPRRSPRRTPAAVEQAVLRARAELGLGPHPLGWALGLAASTVHAILAGTAARGCTSAPRGPRSSATSASGPGSCSITCFKRRWQAGCEARGILVRRTRFRRPQTNGKVERFIRTLLELWAHQRPYPHERERTQALAPALDSYNRLRRHAPSEA